MSEDPDQKKVVNMAEARQRQQTLRPGGQAKGGKPRQGAAAGGKKKGNGSGNQQPRLWVYVQVVLFLLATSYMMTLCHH